MTAWLEERLRWPARAILPSDPPDDRALHALAPAMQAPHAAACRGDRLYADLSGIEPHTCGGS